MAIKTETILVLGGIGALVAYMFSRQLAGLKRPVSPDALKKAEADWARVKEAEKVRQIAQETELRQQMPGVYYGIKAAPTVIEATKVTAEILALPGRSLYEYLWQEDKPVVGVTPPEPHVGRWYRFSSKSDEVFGVGLPWGEGTASMKWKVVYHSKDTGLLGAYSPELQKTYEASVKNFMSVAKMAGAEF